MNRFLVLSRLLQCSLSVTRRVCSNMPFYAVARGITPGVYEKWTDCQNQITGFKGARYKKFATASEAEEFVDEHKAFNPVVDRRAESDKKPVVEDDSSNGAKADSKAEKRKHSSDDESEEEDAEGGSGKKKLATEDKSKFSTDSEGYLIVYTDGACSFNGRHGAQAGVGVFFGHDHPMNVAEPVRGKATNNMAEIQAATYAVELAQASGLKKVAVHTDSQFMINCMTSWLKGWKKKNWVKSDGEPVKNKDELIALDKACEGLAVKWVHVKGHAGHEGNEEADKLARQGAKRYKAPEEDEEK